MRRTEAKRNLERREAVLEQAEKRKADLLQKMSHAESAAEQAAEKRAEEEAMKAERHRLRQEEIARSQERVRRMEENRLQRMMEKVQSSDERIMNLQREKQKEMELMRRIKRDSHIKQCKIKDDMELMRKRPHLIKKQTMRSKSAMDSVGPPLGQRTPPADAAVDDTAPEEDAYAEDFEE